MSIINRLTKESEPYLGLHSFCSALREYARGHITADAIRATYSIPVDDVEANILLSMVDSDPTLEAKLSRLDTFEDILLINEGVDSKTLYPTSTSIRQRLGLL